MSANVKIALSMFIFGTIGLFRRWMPLPSGLVAMARGGIGCAFLLLVLLRRGGRMDLAAIRKKLPLLCLSGVALGVNWMLLFEAYNYTSVAAATLCYYFAPMFIILASPIFLREKITARKIACVGVAFAGMVLVSGVLRPESGGFSGLRGVLLGLCAAVFYACVVLTNKRLGDISANDRTIVQLGVSTVVLLPYVLLTEGVADAQWTFASIALLLVVGVLHTGVAYALYFGALREVRAQSAAILSYIDPVVAVLLSALVLGERMDALSIAGAALILGAAMFSELSGRDARSER